MILNRWKSGERQSAADELARALQTRSDLDPHTQAQIQHIISGRRHAGKHPPQSVIDNIGREVRSVNTLFSGPGRGSGTIGPMSREQIQQERAAMAQRYATASSAERRQMLERARQLDAAAAQGPTNTPSGNVDINLYGARHAREDLEEYYSGLKSPTEEQTRVYTKLKDNLAVLVDEAERRFNSHMPDAANTVLAQARLERDAVEREMQQAVKSRYNIEPKDQRNMDRWWKSLIRGGARLSGATAGAFSGAGLSQGAVGIGLTVGMNSIPVIGGLIGTTIPPLAATLALVLAGGMVGSAAARYVGYLAPGTPLSRKATRAAEARKRIKNMVGRESTYTELEQMLRNNVMNESERVQNMREQLDAEYGGIFKRTGRGLGRSFLYGAGGATIAMGSGAAMAYKEGTLLTGNVLENILDATSEIGERLNSSVSGGVKWLLTKSGLSTVRP